MSQLFNNLKGGTYPTSLPVSLLYISSMVIGYRGLKYLEVSLSSPIQNTSGVITSLLLVIFFKEELPIPAYLAFGLIFAGILYLDMSVSRL